MWHLHDLWPSSSCRAAHCYTAEWSTRIARRASVHRANDARPCAVFLHRAVRERDEIFVAGVQALMSDDDAKQAVVEGGRGTDAAAGFLSASPRLGVGPSLSWQSIGIA